MHKLCSKIYGDTGISALRQLKSLLSGMEAEELIRRYMDVGEDVFLKMRQALDSGDESGGFFGESSYYFKQTQERRRSVCFAA